MTLPCKLLPSDGLYSNPGLPGLKESPAMFSREKTFYRMTGKELNGWISERAATQGCTYPGALAMRAPTLPTLRGGEWGASCLSKREGEGGPPQLGPSRGLPLIPGPSPPRKRVKEWGEGADPRCAAVKVGLPPFVARPWGHLSRAAAPDLSPPFAGEDRTPGFSLAKRGVLFLGAPNTSDTTRCRSLQAGALSHRTDVFS